MSEAARPSSAPRVVAIDVLRGFVMVVMAIDHSSEVFNRGRLMTDAVWIYKPGMALPAAQFFTRWITHLCAPTFVFLAGLSVALVAARPGRDRREVDTFLVKRGLFIALCDPLLVSRAWMPRGAIFQVLYAIGASFMVLPLVRRASPRWLAAAAIGFLLVEEGVIGGALWLGGGEPSLPVALLLTGGRFLDGRVVIAYPLLPWLAIMTLGYAVGAGLPRWDVAKLPGRVALAGLAALGVFATVRGANQYGNLLLARDDGSMVQWLHVSKYPPSLSFAALELGIMALLLAALVAAERRAVRFPGLALLGQTAFFFYLLHIPLLEGAAHLTGLNDQLGLPGTFAAAAACLAALLPACWWWRRYKALRPEGWARYV